jgi:hypothetical protein
MIHSRGALMRFSARSVSPRRAHYFADFSPDGKLLARLETTPRSHLECRRRPRSLLRLSIATASLVVSFSPNGLLAASIAVTFAGL